MTLEYVFKSKIKSATLIIVSYSNWIQLLLAWIASMRVRTLRPRGLHVMSFVNGISFSNVYGLALLIQCGWVPELFDSSHLVLHHGNLRFICRSDVGLDLGHLGEVFVRKVYGNDFKGQIIIDAGMSNGDSAIYFASKGATTVVGLEPYCDSMSLAKRNIELNDMQHIIIPLEAGLGSADRSGSMHVSLKSPEANTFTKSLPTLSELRFDGESKVLETTLGSIIRNFGLNHIDLLKLDCEGCEYEVLRSLSPQDYGQIRKIVLEFHDGQQDLTKILERNGFVATVERGGSGGRFGFIRAVRLTG